MGNGSSSVDVMTRLTAAAEERLSGARPGDPLPLVDAAHDAGAARTYHDLVIDMEGGLEARRRLRELQTRLSDALLMLRQGEPDLDARIEGALRRLGGARTSKEVAAEINARLVAVEDARCAVRMSLGTRMMFSIPDHHPEIEVRGALRRMLRTGSVRLTLPLAIWRGPLWSSNGTPTSPCASAETSV